MNFPSLIKQKFGDRIALGGKTSECKTLFCQLYNYGISSTRKAKELSGDFSYITCNEGKLMENEFLNYDSVPFVNFLKEKILDPYEYGCNLITPPSKRARHGVN